MEKVVICLKCVIEVMKCLPMLISFRFNSTFLNLLLKLDAIWHMQYTEVKPSSSEATSRDCNADNIVVPLSVIMHRFD